MPTSILANAMDRINLLHSDIHKYHEYRKKVMPYTITREAQAYVLTQVSVGKSIASRKSLTDLILTLKTKGISTTDVLFNL